ncbi:MULTISPECIES: hypothetical protein [unclassified Sphingomonas]|uniref:hypothetical protein n=1 Tax=unclassified Sphingomonas TaxID=196159 RepID=UPI000926E723|nr:MULTISPECIES: hypothetical protein [unclassified Sphingomonas]OJU22851.1 MAG: hypothetical protein BGN95_05245 [Sphingomonas sp. 66-10]
MPNDDVAEIRGELARRIAAIAPRRGAAALAREIDAIRRIAHHNNMLPAVTVAHLLESALARGEQGVLVHDWLAMLDEAVHSDCQDAATSDAFAAACQVRFA